MISKIVRIDGKEYDITFHTFTNYAYDLLDRIYGDTCYSDEDFEDINYYDIVKS